MADYDIFERLNVVEALSWKRNNDVVMLALTSISILLEVNFGRWLVSINYDYGQPESNDIKGRELSRGTF